jgi:hypothetical protein
VSGRQLRSAPFTFSNEFIRRSVAAETRPWPSLRPSWGFLNPPDDETFEAFDLSPYTDALERTSITTKADALAALDLIREETLLSCTHLPIIKCQPLRNYVASI